MCGICGVLHNDSNYRVERSALEGMSAAIIHRGPDDEGLLLDGNLGLAMRRLSIIDVEGGHQPMANENQNLWIVYNGEIYNHRKLRHHLESRGHHYHTRSDTETILHLYEEYGPACVHLLEGMFAFAIWNKRERRLFVARDRLGIKPLYYRADSRAFLLASEIKAILAYPGVTAKLNRDIIAEYLAFGYITGSQTMFVGVHKLLPGHILEIGETGPPKIQQYWDFPVGHDSPAHPRDYYVREYRQLLEQSVNSHLMSDVPLGVFLSGGLDSSVVAALATKARGAPVQTFSVGYSEDDYSELPYARQVAEHIGSQHHEVKIGRREFFDVLPRLIYQEDEPLVWPSSVSLYFVAKLAREYVTVVLTGEGSDETLAGYTRYAWTLRNAPMDAVYRALTPPTVRQLVRKGIEASPFPGRLQRKLAHTFLVRDGDAWSSSYFDNFYSAFSAEEQKGLLDDDVLTETSNAYAGSLQHWNEARGDLLHRLLYTDIKTYLVELLMKQDQMSMAASIESRVPFLDHKLVEFTATIPSRFSVNGLSGKSILKEAAVDLLPRPVVHRQKMGFPTPWSSWLGEELDHLQSVLAGPRATTRGLFKKEAIARLFAEHRSGRRDNGNRIWRLLNLELWQRIFMDGDRAWDARDTTTVAATS
jgi:asparagine synthase (glutamine-hydrolysing)